MAVCNYRQMLHEDFFFIFLLLC